MKQKNKKSFFDLLAEKIAWFMGSWWGVAAHIAWWATWFIFGLDFLTLTLWLSIEAIWIGIFILMVQNRAERERAELMSFYNKSEMETLERDVKLDEKFDRRQLEIVREIREIRKDLHLVKNHSLKNNKKDS